MATKRKFKSEAFEAINSAVEGMYAAGTIDKETMRTFDEACLSVLEELTLGEIKALRESNHVSQPVFARYLNTSESTVQTGAKAPFDRAQAWPRNAILEHNPTGTKRGSIRVCFKIRMLERRSDSIGSKRALIAGLSVSCR